jgi:hypothetical protein
MNYKLKQGFKGILTFPSSKPKWWALLRAFLVAFPAFILGYTAFDYKEDAPLLHAYLCNLLIDNAFALPLLIVSPFLISLLLEIAEWFSRYIKSREVKYFPSLQLATAISSLNIIVGKKLDRFGKICKSVINRELPKEDVFNQLTQPDEQISEIVRQFHASMRTLTDIKDLKVVLVGVKNEKPQEYVNYMPLNERPSDDILASGKSFFHSVAQQKRFVCIPCLETYQKGKNKESGKRRGRRPNKELTFFTVNNVSLRGSIAGIPIKHNHIQEVAYVLTLRSEIPNAITKKFETDFQSIWNVFTDRIILEHSLKCIKNYVTSTNN